MQPTQRQPERRLLLPLIARRLLVLRPQLACRSRSFRPALLLRQSLLRRLHALSLRALRPLHTARCPLRLSDPAVAVVFVRAHPAAPQHQPRAPPPLVLPLPLQPLLQLQLVVPSRAQRLRRVLPVEHRPRGRSRRLHAR